MAAEQDAQHGSGAGLPNPATVQGGEAGTTADAAQWDEAIAAAIRTGPRTLASIRETIYNEVKQEIRSQLTGDLAAIMNPLTTAIENAIKTPKGGAGAEKSTFNDRRAERLTIPEFQGRMDKEGFNNFADLVKNWAQALFDRGLEVMHDIEKLDTEDDIIYYVINDGPEVKEFSERLHEKLISVCKGDAKAFAKDRERNGLMSWYRLVKEFDPRELVDKTVAYEQLVRPSPCRKLDEAKTRLRSWWIELTEYEGKFGEIDETAKILAIKTLVPRELTGSAFVGKKHTKAKAFFDEVNDFVAERTFRDAGKGVKDGMIMEVPEKDEKLDYIMAIIKGKGFNKGGKGGKGYPSWGASPPRVQGGKGNEKGGKDGGKGGKNGGGLNMSGWYKGKGRDSNGVLICYKCGGAGHKADSCNKNGGSIQEVNTQEPDAEKEENVAVEEDWGEQGSWGAWPGDVIAELRDAKGIEEKSEEREKVTHKYITIPSYLRQTANHCRLRATFSNTFQALGEEMSEEENQADDIGFEATGTNGDDEAIFTSARRTKPKMPRITNRRRWKSMPDMNSLEDYDGALTTLICEVADCKAENDHKGAKYRWEKHKAAVDSAAVECVMPAEILPHIKTYPSERSKSGRHYMAANNKEIRNVGQSQVGFVTGEGLGKKINFQRAEVGRILVAADKLTDAGCTVILNKKAPRIITKQGETIKIKREKGMFILDMWIRVPMTGCSHTGENFSTDGNRGAILAPVFAGQAS